MGTAGLPIPALWCDGALSFPFPLSIECQDWELARMGSPLLLFNKWGVMVHVEIKEELSGVLLLCHFVESGDQIQVIRPVRKCWYPLSISPVNN